MDGHYNKIKSVLIFILVLNWAAALVKIAYGLLTRSSSMTADGLHSLADGLSNVIGIVGIGLASQPKDTAHPYGHKKYETLFSLAIGAFLFFICFNLFKEGVSRIFHPVLPRVDWASFVVLAATLCVNFLVMNYEYRKGRLLKSDILVSDSMHTRADILTSFSVIAALIAVRLGYPIVDPIVTILISALIAHAGFEIVRDSSRVLTDTVAVANTSKIEKVVLGVKGVKTCHKIRTRGREDDIYIDLHVQVSPHMHVDNAHVVCFEIEEALKKSIAGVTDIVVHIEPIKTEGKRVS